MDEPTLSEVPDNADQPATTNDVYQLEQRLEKRFSLIDERLEAIDRSSQSTDVRFDAMAQLIRDVRDELTDHFDAALENIEDEMKGANRDEIEWLKGKQAEHDQRLSQLEEQASP